MKGYRFFAEMPEERVSKSASKAYPFFPWTVAQLRERAAQGYRATCVAVFLDDSGRPLWNGVGDSMESMAVAIDGNHSSYCVTGVTREYLRKRAVRVPGELARRLSPELFRRLEAAQ